MIFIDGERQMDFRKEREILKGIFPNSFDVPNPAPIAIHRKKGSYETATLFKPAVTDVPLGQRTIMPPPTVFSVTGRMRMEDNIMHQWNYSESFPQSSGDSAPVFKQRGVHIHHGMTIDPERDFEKLVYLWFYSKGFTNNYRANGFAFYEFVIPAQAAKVRIDSAKVVYKYMSELLVEETRMSYDKLKSIMTMLNIKGNGIEEEERTDLYDKVIANRAQFASRYDQAKANAEAMESKTGESASNVSALIKTLIKDLVLVEKDGMWVVKNKEGADQRIITEVKGSKKADKENNLIKHMAVSPEDLEYLESL
jgi:hypothetical protein